MRFIETKLELLEAHLIRLEQEIYKTQSMINDIQYELQQKEWHEINSYETVFRNDFKDSLDCLQKLGRLE